MDIKVIYNIYNALINDNLSLVYHGNFSDDVTAKILDLSENNIDDGVNKNNIKRKVAFIVVESFQNVIRHKEDIEVDGEDDLSGLFLTRNIGKDYLITSANIIDNDSVGSLKDLLKNINSLSKEELKELYLKKLEASELSERGGAGLGLIEMARRSGNKLEYDFEKIDEQFSYFYLRVKISSGSKEVVEELKLPLDTAKNFRQDMKDNNVLMVYKGDFSQQAIIPVLNMIENNLAHKEETELLQKKIYWVLIELLQNVSRHALSQKKDGIFLLGKGEDGKYFVGTGNPIHPDNEDIISKHLDHVNNLSLEGLNELYKETLREGKRTEKGGAGLGIIDIARESNREIDYSFTEIDENVKFFSLNIRI